ncbi:MAG: ABC transporter substrate-binding protein [Bacillota bacterium]
MKWQRVLALLLVIAMVTLLLGACTGAPGEEPEGEETEEPEETEETEEPEEPTGPTSLVMAASGAMGDVNPLVGLHLTACWVAINVHDTLVQKAHHMGPAGYLVEDTDNVEPGLATDWEISDDDLTYTFNLREGVEFHDGSSLTADDVEFTFDLVLTVGAAADYFSSVISEVEVVDSHTVKFHLNRVEPIFLQQLSTYHTCIMSKEAILREAGEDPDAQMQWLGSNLIGTGPYVMLEQMSDYVRFEANDDYWGGRPAIDEVSIQVVDEASSRRVLLERGDIDINVSPEKVNYEALDQNPDIDLVVRPSTTRIFYVGMNVAKPPFDDRRVREAIAHAIPYEDILNVVLGGERYSVRARSILTSDMAAFVPVYDYEYDLDRAAELLEEAGYGDGLQITWNSSTAEQFVQIGTMLQAELAKIGVDMEVSPQSGATYFPAGREGEFGLFFVSWWSRTGDPVDLIDAIAHSSEFNRGNWVRLENDELDELIELARVEMDVEQRNEYLREAQQILADEMVYAVIYEGSVVYGMNKSVQGYVHYSDNLIRFDDLRIE